MLGMGRLYDNYTRYVISFALIVMSVSNSSGQWPLRTVGMTVNGHPSPGYILLAPNSPDSIAFVDNTGINVFARPAQGTNNFQYQPDGSVTHYSTNGYFLRRNANMDVIDTLRVTKGFEVNFHAVRVLKNGNCAILGTEQRMTNLSKTVPGGLDEVAILGAVIQERTRSGQVVFEWKSLDHIPVTDATEDIDLKQRTIDYIHVNSIDEDIDGNFLVSCRNTDEVVKIDRTKGTIIWRMGGSKSKGNQFTFLNDDIDGFTGFSHQHSVSRLPNGNIIMFDNGNLRAFPFSRAVEYKIDEASHTAERVWQYRRKPDVFARSMGSVQVLPNENVLIGWGTIQGSVIGTEVQRDGTVEMELTNISPKPFLTYGVFKAIVGMTGVERMVSADGPQDFSVKDSTTYVSMLLTNVLTPTSIIVERHSYAPHAMTFASEAPARMTDARWVIRIRDSDAVQGTTTFAIDHVQHIASDTGVRLYYRPKEGDGTFSLLPAVYDATKHTLLLPFVRSGEYFVGSAL